MSWLIYHLQSYSGLLLNVLVNISLGYSGLSLNVLVNISLTELQWTFAKCLG